MLQAAKQLAINPKDPPTYQMYSTHSKSVSDSIKRLVSAIRSVFKGGRMGIWFLACLGLKRSRWNTLLTGHLITG